MATTEYSLDRGLPASSDAERSILGAILLDNQTYYQASEALRPDDFFLDSHRRIYARMQELAETGRPVDLVTLSEELGRRKEVEAIGGVAYLASLTEGMPRRPSIEQYVRIVKDKALLRGLIAAANSAIAMAMDGSETAADIIESAENSIFQIAQGKTSNTFATVQEIAKDSFGSIDELCAPRDHVTGLETFYTDLDQLTNGFQKADLVVIAGRPSMGKTAFALNIAENSAVLGGKTVGIFSLEMNKAALLRRMLCSQARVDSQKLNKGFVGREEIAKLTKGLVALTQAKLFIDDTPGISISEIRAKCRRLQQSEGTLDLVIVDYLQLMSAVPIGGGGKRYENRTQEVSAISRGLKAIAKELDVPVVALSQLSRAPEQRGGKDNEPKLSDLRESGAIEQDADIVIFIFRPEYYDRDADDWANKAKIIVAKQRNGPTATIQMGFQRFFTRFDTLDSSLWVR